MAEKRYRMSYGDEQVIIDSFEKNSFSPYYEGVSRIINRLNEQHETITDNEEYIKDLEYQLKGFKKDYNDCGEYLKECQQKVKDTLQKLSSKYRQIRRKQFENQYDSISWSLEAQHCLGKIQAIDEIAEELGIDLQ